MPVIKCRVCGAVATAQIEAGRIVTSCGASFRENCRFLVGRKRGSVSACPQMAAALAKLAHRSRRHAQRKPGRHSRARAERTPAETRPPIRNDRAAALFSTHPHKAAFRWRTLMREQKLADAYKAWRQALENMREALTMNPLVTEPLRASAEAFESVGRVLFGSPNGAAGPARSARKTGTRTAASHSRSKAKTRPRRRGRPAKKG